MKPRRFRDLRFLSIPIAFLLISATASAAVLHVSTNGNDGNSGTSWALAKKTVQAAIDAANAGDEVWVAAGIYNEHITNKAVGDVAVDVALYGGFDGSEGMRSERDIAANPTVLHGTNNGIVVTIKYGAGRTTRIDGFYITGGNKSATPGDPGGGIHMTGSAPTIANNIIKGNLTSLAVRSQFSTSARDTGAWSPGCSRASTAYARTSLGMSLSNAQAHAHRQHAGHNEEQA